MVATQNICKCYQEIHPIWFKHLKRYTTGKAELHHLELDHEWYEICTTRGVWLFRHSDRKWSSWIMKDTEVQRISISLFNTEKEAGTVVCLNGLPHLIWKFKASFICDTFAHTATTDRREKAVPTIKSDLFQLKVLLSTWWDMSRVISCEFL